MKTMIKIKNLGLALATLFLMMFSVASYSQACPGNNVTVTVQNITNPTPATTVEFDVYIQNTSPNTIKLASLSGALFHNVGFATTGTFTVVTQPAAADFVGLNAIASTAYTAATSQLRWTQNPVLEGAAVDLPAGGPAKKFARFRFVRTGTPFPQNFLPAFTFAEYVQSGVTAVNPNVYCNGNGSSTPLANGAIGPPAINNGYLTVGGPYNFIVNPGGDEVCIIAATQTSSTALTCAGDSNGTSTITISPIPTVLGANYVLDGGASTPVTLSAGGTFTISGLAAGAHTVVLTGSPACTTPVTVTGVSIAPGTALTTNGSGPVTACNSYTWALPLGTGLTYTTEGTYTSTVGCNTATLVLTINNSTTGTTTAAACNTYTWALPLGSGLTYTTSQAGITNVTTNAAGCSHTQTLNLTINNSTTGTTTASACNTYTWAAPLGNGQTYTTSQAGVTNVTTNAAGCSHTQTLNLTINNSTTGTTTATACNTYTWAAPLGNGQTYTSSQSGVTFVSTNAAGCSHTQTLNLTINSSTTSGSLAITSSTPYTWPLPFGTGLTYSVGGVYTNTTTNAAGCPNVATLNLTITTGTVNTFNIGTSCGATVTNLAVTITATPVAGATSYTFRLTNMTTSAVVLINRPVNNFALSNYPGITLGTPYQIEVSVNGGPFGPACTVITPSPVSNIGAQCGTTLTSMTQYVYATYVASVTGYRFRVTNNTTSAVQVFDSSLNRFFFNQLASRSFGTTYLVEVALRNNDGTYLPYSTGCNITTPAFPTTAIQASQCGATATGNTQNFYADVVSGATDYRFLLSRASAPTYNSSVDKVLNSFNLSAFAGLAAGTTYNVQVAVRIGGVWGPYGSVCTLTTPGTVRVINAANVAFKAIAYPNPFANDFKFDVTTTADSTIQIRVYDMLGKQVENRNIEATDIENLQVGAAYPSGVYNVIVSQGENTQTLRVIKR
jgi:hypothetical protein